MRRVLLVDDDETMLFAFKQLSRTSSFHLDTADNPESAVNLIAQHQYDIVITDLNLAKDGKQEGLEIIRIARQKIPSVYAVVWTAYENGDVMELATAAGADKCLIKPVRYDTIRSIIETEKI